MKEDRGTHRRGDIIEVRASGSPFVGKEPNDFVMVEVPDVPIADFDDKSHPWQRSLAFEVVGRSVPLDGYRLRIYSDNTNSTAGAVTRSEVASFITSWGGTIFSHGPNEVVFDLTVHDALTSNEFWEFDISNVVFTEQSYDQGTGVHRIEADYSTTGINNTTYVERRGMRQNATIVSHADKVIVYEATSANVADDVREFIKHQARKRNARRRYYFGEAVVDALVAAGGTMTTDRATVENYIKDKLAD